MHGRSRLPGWQCAAAVQVQSRPHTKTPQESSALLHLMPPLPRRLDHTLGHMLRLRPDGSKLTWRVAAMSKFEEAGREPKPFFITWDDPSVRPDKARAARSLLPPTCP